MSGYTMECLKNLDLKKIGLYDTVQQNIRRNRMQSVRIKVVSKDGSPINGAKISVKETDGEFKFGCNAFMVNQFESEEQNKTYAEKFKSVFNQAVVPFYWKDDEPEEGKYRFEKGSEPIYRRPPADEVLEWCEKLNIQPKGHNMVWLNNEIGLPEWMPKDKTKMQKCIDDRIRMLAEKYADKIPVWDVCNEVAEAGVYEDMPEDYEVRAHKLADELFPDCHLIYNDYAGFYGGSYRGKRTLTYQLAKKIIQGGGRIDGIGMQNHFFIREENISSDNDMLKAEHILDMLNIYSDLADSIHVSEITVPSYDSTPEKLEVQANITENLYRLWFSVKNVKSIVWWNLIDGFAFVNPNSDWNEDYYGGGLLNHDFSEKPAYKAIKRLINEEWHTEFDSETDESGIVSAEVFKGKYDITVNGKLFKAEVNDKTNTVKITLD